ncbi:DUF1499 domain-containing protein [Yoonia litorea]|uniref:Uncharacterized conserved protein, DUF1499 family n=1 Tax=Yoonia litorea TaxID=1123755 RepID=A0A1I6LZZ1_9RHOB|nr:DUF1499 domain-containing protein [Yoonia litorea]SFS08954.1 Uncharacterized conserved protein, DUF1499 family [Yoonia litorea]
MRILIIVLVLIAGPMLYIRLAPTSVDRWHNRPTATEPSDQQDEGGFTAVRRITAPAVEVLAAFEQRALATPRTTLLAGSVAERLLTFETRSLIWGFPDYTTVTVENDLLIVYGRLRFGRSDMGVNKARIQGWLDSLGPLTEPL